MRLLDFGLAQFDEAETLTAVGDVPGTLAYISPERLRGEEACPASDVWGVGILLWEALAAKHPFWGVPLPADGGDDRGRRPAAADGAARPAEAAARRSRPCGGARPGEAALRRRARGGAARRADGAEAFDKDRKCCFNTKSPSRASRPPRPPARRRSSARAALPFYPTGWAAALAVVAAARGAPRPRVGLALALAAPVLPLGNLALGLALVYAALALAWLALSWRDARAGLLFLAGPLLAPLGLLALVPVAALAARGAVRRAAQARRRRRRRGDRGRDARRRAAVRPGRCAAPLGLAGAESVDRDAPHARRRRSSGLALEALALAAIAVALPYARTPVADRRTRRRRARGYPARRPGRARAAARARGLAHLRRTRR